MSGLISEVVEALSAKKELRHQLVKNLLEEYARHPGSISSNAQAILIMDACYRPVSRCCLCDHIGTDVNHFHSYHVGGKGDVREPCCDNPEDCISRVEFNKEQHGRLSVAR